jgi:hypothetical protein
MHSCVELMVVQKLKSVDIPPKVTSNLSLELDK